MNDASLSKETISSKEIGPKSSKDFATTPKRRSFIAQNPSVLWFLLALAAFTLGVTLLSEATGSGVISTSFVKTLGKTLCLCLVAIAMDVVWGYCGILSLGHFAFFGIGGYAVGMWLMYARTELDNHSVHFSVP